MLWGLYIVVVLSGLIELATGVWLAIDGADHPLIQSLVAGQAGDASEGGARFLAWFAAAACLLAAGLHWLAWRWLRRERDEGHQIITLYGAFALVGGVLLSLRGDAGLPAGVFLLVDSLRGALMVAFSAIVRFRPNTLSRLRLPSQRGRGRLRAQRRPPEGRALALRGRRPRKARAPGRLRERPAADASRASSRGSELRGVPAMPEDAEPLGMRTAREHERVSRRSRRRTPRGRRASGLEPGGDPGSTGAGSSGSRAASSRAAAAQTPEIRFSEARSSEVRPSEVRSTEARSSEARSSEVRSTEARREEPGEGARSSERRRGSRSRGRRGSRRPGSSRGREEESRGVEPPAGPPRAASADPPERAPVEAADTSQSKPTTFAEIELPVSYDQIGVGPRRKKGRYSTGALFRPREKRARRALGGGAALYGGEWAWPAEAEAEPRPPSGVEREAASTVRETPLHDSGVNAVDAGAAPSPDGSAPSRSEPPREE